MSCSTGETKRRREKNASKAKTNSKVFRRFVFFFLFRSPLSLHMMLPCRCFNLINKFSTSPSRSLHRSRPLAMPQPFFLLFAYFSRRRQSWTMHKFSSSPRSYSSETTTTQNGRQLANRKMINKYKLSWRSG